MGVWTDLLKGAFKFFARDTISTTSASAPSASTSAPNTTSEELVNHTPAITHSLATAALNRTLYENLEEIMDIERYGSKLKLLRVTAYVLKFIRLLRGDRGAVKSKELKAEDLNFAEVTWIRGVQAHSFATERQNLLHGCERSNSTYILMRTRLFAVRVGSTMQTQPKKARIQYCYLRATDTQNC